LARFYVGVSVSVETLSRPEPILGHRSLREAIPFPETETVVSSCIRVCAVAPSGWKGRLEYPAYGVTGAQVQHRSLDKLKALVNQINSACVDKR
jgi:hypothetical protein